MFEGKDKCSEVLSKIQIFFGVKLSNSEIKNIFFYDQKPKRLIHILKVVLFSKIEIYLCQFNLEVNKNNFYFMN